MMPHHFTPPRVGLVQLLFLIFFFTHEFSIEAVAGKRLSSGSSFACALHSPNDLLSCWGQGFFGDGVYTGFSDHSIEVSDIAVPTDFATGNQHSCAILTGGAIKCWGSNAYGQLGDDTKTDRKTPVSVTSITSAIAVRAGDHHTCAILSGGTIKCWGYNFYGQLGNGTSSTNSDRATPVTVSSITTAVAIGLGSIHSCALLSDGTIKCWGDNSIGQRGDGTTVLSSTPISVLSITTAVALTVGSFHSCATLSDGTVKCWGSNSSGQFGDGTTTSRASPVTISALNNAVVAIALGESHSCAILVDSVIKCWGYNGYGQLGDGSTTRRTSPVPVSISISNATEISAGGRHTCIYRNTDSGQVICFGDRRVLGNSDNFVVSPVIPISTSTVVATGYVHSCALLSGGTIKCWGGSGFGQLGDGTGLRSDTPVSVENISTAVAVAGGSYHTCAVLSTGTAKCWGFNFDGQLGDGTTTQRNSPVSVSSLSNATAIAAGDGHSCAILSDGTIKCWGSNNNGQLGNGTFASISGPVLVSSITNAVAMASGAYHSCAILSDETVKCWGGNFDGQLGDGRTDSSNTPVSVSSVTSAIAIGAGYAHSCALSDGTVKCWGRNDHGQLGDGTKTNRLTPVAVSSITNAVALAVGDGHSCAVLSGGTVKCWGYNEYDQLGDGSTTDRDTPVTVLPLTNAVAVAAGKVHSCALLSGGTIRCWGEIFQLAHLTYLTVPNLPVVFSHSTEAPVPDSTTEAPVLSSTEAPVPGSTDAPVHTSTGSPVPADPTESPTSLNTSSPTLKPTFVTFAPEPANSTEAPTIAIRTDSPVTPKDVNFATYLGDPHLIRGVIQATTGQIIDESMTHCNGTGWRLFAQSVQWKVEVFQSRRNFPQGATTIEKVRFTSLSSASDQVEMGDSALTGWQSGKPSSSSIFTVKESSSQVMFGEKYILSSDVSGPDLAANVGRWLWTNADNRLLQPKTVSVTSKALLGGIAKFGCPEEDLFDFNLTPTGRRLAGNGTTVEEIPLSPACNGLAGEFKKSCNYDVAKTNDPVFANVTVQAQTLRQEIVAKGVEQAKTSSNSASFNGSNLLVQFMVVTVLITTMCG